MAKLSRVFQKIFGQNADNSDLGVVGSLKAGTPRTAANVGRGLDALMNLSNYLAGLRACVDTNDAPALQDHNSLFFIITSQLAYLFQSGIPEWNSQTEYYANSSICQNGGIIYSCIVDNTNIEPGVTAGWDTYWRSFDLQFDNTPTQNSIKAVTSGGIYTALENLNDALLARVPVGTILPYAANYLPEGFVLCNGQAIDRGVYSALFSKIGIIYGAGDSVSTFNVPNFSDRTFWGGNILNVGTVKEAGLPNIKGTYAWGDRQSVTISKSGSLFDAGIINNFKNGGGSSSNIPYMGFDASLSSSIYKNNFTTVQPPAIQVQFIIKY